MTNGCGKIGYLQKRRRKERRVGKNEKEEEGRGETELLWKYVKVNSK